MILMFFVLNFLQKINIVYDADCDAFRNGLLKNNTNCELKLKT